MKTHCLFLSFVLLIALRDILAEIWLIENAITFAFFFSSITALLSLSMICAKGKTRSFIHKLRQSGVWYRVLPLGILSIFVYALGYFLIKRVGAGLFNVVDYGLTPIVTVILARVLFGEKIKKGFEYSLLFYVVGLFMLNFHRSADGWAYLLLVLLIPIAVAISDALTKWLLDPRGVGFTKEELLFLRFVPGALTLGLLAPEVALQAREPASLVLVSVLCGWLPLWILCTVLANAKLSQLAYWELLIPGLTFFGTLPWHLQNHLQLIPIAGALLIIFSQYVPTLLAKIKFPTFYHREAWRTHD